MTIARASKRSAQSANSHKPADTLLHVLGGDVVERVELPAREARTASLPEAYRSNLVITRVLHRMSPTVSIWQHQALALEHVAHGRNVLITTGTGSGKSLAFQLPLLRELTEGDGTAVVFYPQLALSSDQLRRWRELLVNAGLNPELVGEINGDTDMADRDEIVARCRILLLTPDITHAWLLRQQSGPVLQRFLAGLNIVAIDEAHALEGAFGSSCAYMFRRLRLAASLARGGQGNAIQWIAASATIGNPSAHLEALTGTSFVHVGDEQNGAPQRGMTLLHVEGPEHGSAAESFLVEALAKLANELRDEAAVAFLNGRQAVERVTRKLADDRILPYRSGYERKDRQDIEEALLAGQLRACVATSALELGIDIAGFRTGLNLGVPPSRKSLRQRAGRVGRAASGAFAVVAPRNAFGKLGTTFEDFVLGRVEEGHLYLGNRAIQFQQAACLHKETGGKSIELGSWPDGFAEIYDVVRGGKKVPDDLQALASMAGNEPHFSFPLRHIAGRKFTLKLAGSGAAAIGTIAEDKALREAYPGATYLHNRRAYQVIEWRESAFESIIYLEAAKAAPPTSAMISSKAEASLDPADLLSTTVLTSERGSIAERRLRITQCVHGYTIAGKTYAYRDLSKDDGRKQSKYRQFDSTGVVIRISEPWFAGTSEARKEVRKRVAKALRAVLLAEQGVLASEVGEAHGAISLRTLTGGQAVDDAIVIFDEMAGGLRLTEPLFTRFPELLDRLRKGADLAGEDKLLDLDTIERLADWHLSLSAQAGPVSSVIGSGIYAPGSQLGAMIHGRIVSRLITGHQVMCIDGTEQLMYSYQDDAGRVGWVSHDSLRPIGDDWSFLADAEQLEGEVRQ